MPYFIYRISQDNELECIDKYEKYREARDQVRNRRTEQGSEDGSLIRLIHANSESEAERLLLTPREAPVEGDD